MPKKPKLSLSAPPLPSDVTPLIRSRQHGIEGRPSRVPAEPVAEPDPKPESKREERKRKRAELARQREPPERITVAVPESVAERVRTACYWTPGMTVARFATEAFVHEIERREKERGAPFEPIPDGESLHLGRPPGR